jgi:4-hydroxy-tetrahydrodipicolinate synthase
MDINGIIPAIVTPIRQDQTVNEEVLRQLVSHLIDNGVHGIFALGTNGEFHLFNKEDKIKIAQTVIKEANGRVPVIIGAGGNSTEESIEMSKEMEALGADALSVITPYFIAPSQEELKEHFLNIAESTSLPVLLYNIPARTGVNIEPETAVALADVPNIVGIKDSSGNFENLHRYIKLTKNKEFSVLAGTDSLILQTLKAGGAGAVAATANLLPEIVVSIYSHWKNGELEEAEKAQGRLQPLRDTFKYGTLPSALKKAVVLSGIDVGPPKLPVRELEGEGLEIVKEMVSGYSKLRV